MEAITATTGIEKLADSKYTFNHDATNVTDERDDTFENIDSALATRVVGAIREAFTHTRHHDPISLTYADASPMIDNADTYVEVTIRFKNSPNYLNYLTNNYEQVDIMGVEPCMKDDEMWVEIRYRFYTPVTDEPFVYEDEPRL